MDERERHVGPAPHHLAAEGEGAREIALRVEPDHLLDLGVERDEPLGIVLRGVVLAGGGGGTRQVAEGAQPRQRLRVLLASLQAAVGGAEAGQLPAHRLHQVRPRRGEVLLFLRVVAEVVQLRQWKVDELEAAAHDSLQRRPAPVDRSRERLEIALVGVGGAPFREAEEAVAGQAGRGSERERVEDRGQQVHVADRRRHGSGGQKRRLVQDEGDAQRALVGEDAVGLLSVLAARLAVVAGHHDQRAAGPSGFEDGIEQGLEDRVRRRDLALVRVVAMLGGEGLRGHVGEVRLVDVHPQERGRGALRAQPPERGGDGLTSWPLLHPERGV